MIGFISVHGHNGFSNRFFLLCVFDFESTKMIDENNMKKSYLVIARKLSSSMSLK